jgi:hypothetical protein
MRGPVGLHRHRAQADGQRPIPTPRPRVAKAAASPPYLLVERLAAAKVACVPGKDRRSGTPKVRLPRGHGRPRPGGSRPPASSGPAVRRQDTRLTRSVRPRAKTGTSGRTQPACARAAVDHQRTTLLINPASEPSPRNRGGSVRRASPGRLAGIEDVPEQSFGPLASAEAWG